MKKISGHIIKSLPFEGLERISNLIEFEGPLLSHYKDRFGNNYLYYWVDQDKINNRWLVWEVAEDFLILYLSGQVPLLTLFPRSGKVLYCIDIDNEIKYSKVLLTYSDFIPDDYQPEPDAYFKFDLPVVYKDKVDISDYLKGLKERALYINVEPASGRYKRTIGIEDIWNVFESIGKSFSEYVEFNVKSILSERLTDKNRILNVANSLSSPNRLRIVYLNLNSFHVGISADHLNIDHTSMDRSVENFSQEVLAQYKNDVLDNDFSSTEDINILIHKYSNEDLRKKIFNPIIDIINNDNIKVNIADYTKTFEKSYSRIPKIERDKLLPAKSKRDTQLTKPDQELMVAYVIADKSTDQTQGSLFPKDMNRVLYFKSADTFPFEIDKIIQPSLGKDLPLASPIKIEGTFDDGMFFLSYEPLGIEISATNKKQLEERFNKALGELYEAYIGGAIIYQPAFQKLIGN